MKEQVSTSSFFDIFRLGVELEGEFKSNPEEYLNEWEVDQDDSICCHHDGYDNELRTGLIENIKDEKRYLQDLEKMVEDEDNKNFAYKNNSCGTHVHFSFKKDYGHGDDNLYVFDTVDFAKYFFKRYFARFKHEKFINRPRNSYSQSTVWLDLNNSPSKRVLNKKGREMYSLEDSVKMKAGSQQKFLWLTMYGIADEKGAELRIFPYIQSIAGLKAVLNFTKSVLLSYFLMKKTQQRLEDINIFHDQLQKSELIPEKLNEFEKIALSRLSASLKGCEDGLFDDKACGDTKIMLANLFKRKKKAFKLVETTEIPF